MFELTKRQIDVLETLAENKRAYVMREYDRKANTVKGGALVFAGPGGAVIRADRLSKVTINALTVRPLLKVVKCIVAQTIVINHFVLSPAGLKFLREREQKRKER